MAYWINDSVPYSPSRQVQYFMDSDSDKDNLPTSSVEGASQGDSVTSKECGKGSIALSIGSGKLFVLDSEDNWTEIGG